MLPVPKAKTDNQEGKFFSCKILMTNRQNLRGDSKLKIAKVDQEQEGKAEAETEVEATRNNDQRAIEISG